MPFLNKKVHYMNVFAKGEQNYVFEQKLFKLHDTYTFLLVPI